MRALDFITGTAFLMALVALPFSLCHFHRKPIPSVLIFGIPLLIAFGTCNTSQHFAQDEVLDKLDALDGRYQLSLNGTSVRNPDDILLALRNLRWLPAHHSNPTNRINVEISRDSCQIVLSLARDSGNPREYWVFYPKYYLTTYNEIGRIVTPVFDNY